jgi:hypothetical protein
MVRKYILIPITKLMYPPQKGGFFEIVYNHYWMVTKNQYGEDSVVKFEKGSWMHNAQFEILNRFGSLIEETVIEFRLIPYMYLEHYCYDYIWS